VVEVGRGAELATRQERGLQIAVGALNDAFRFRVERFELHDFGGQRPGEPGHPVGQASAAADAGLVVPHQPPRHRRPSCSASSNQIPASRSGVVRDGTIKAVMQRENEATTTSTGGEQVWSPPTGIFAGGNHRSHWAWSPG